MRVWFHLLAASLQAQLAYRRSFLLEATGRFAVTTLELVAVIVMFDHVRDLAGWGRWEVVYLYGVASLSLGLAELLTDGLRDMPDLVRTGTFDGVLVRPAPALVQVLGRQCRPHHSGRIACGALALGAGLAGSGAVLGLAQRVMVVVNVASAAVVYGALFVIGAASCVWTVQSTELLNAFTYGGVQMTQLPVPIYRPWLRAVFLWIVPVGFASYFPAVVVLGKSDPLGLPAWTGWLAPAVSATFLVFSLVLWSAAVRRYRSTGS